MAKMNTLEISKTSILDLAANHNHTRSVDTWYANMCQRRFIYDTKSNCLLAIARGQKVSQIR
nr:hypothetical protein [Otarine picobirnavirus]